jgi:hypothetical protein
MSMSWDDVVRTLKARGFRHYSASTGPIEIDWWSGPHGGKTGYWIFVGHDTIRRDPKYGYPGGDEEYSFC